ncbi:DNA protection during starvation protein-like [Globicephala melas]|uniref:DNA protection during starvation protein-like n=1 Tax=Globicephala melas TaxID=9731 RepID=UPI00293D6C9A|nr:DNA protection during starvation protein-like [Globicephala melas]
MNVLDITGLKAENLTEVVKGLELLLADLQVHYTNLRGYHWHVKGKDFAILHERFEKMYDEVADKVDEVAERLLQLNVEPENRYSVILAKSEIKEVTGLTSPETILPEIVKTYKTLMALERSIIEKAGEVNDETTVAIMSDFLVGQEKDAWFLASMLS